MCSEISLLSGAIPRSNRARTQCRIPKRASFSSVEDSVEVKPAERNRGTPEVRLVNVPEYHRQCHVIRCHPLIRQVHVGLVVRAEVVIDLHVVAAYVRPCLHRRPNRLSSPRTRRSNRKPAVFRPSPVFLVVREGVGNQNPGKGNGWYQLLTKQLPTIPRLAAWERLEQLP